MLHTASLRRLVCVYRARYSVCVWYWVQASVHDLGRGCASGLGGVADAEVASPADGAAQVCPEHPRRLHLPRPRRLLPTLIQGGGGHVGWWCARGWKRERAL
eukprot:3935351-Rhodomonas_salina.1